MLHMYCILVQTVPHTIHFWHAILMSFSIFNVLHCLFYQTQHGDRLWCVCCDVRWTEGQQHIGITPSYTNAHFCSHWSIFSVVRNEQYWYCLVGVSDLGWERFLTRSLRQSLSILNSVHTRDDKGLEMCAVTSHESINIGHTLTSKELIRNSKQAANV